MLNLAKLGIMHTMDDEAEKIQKEIDELNGMIESYEDTDPLYLHKYLKDLRNKAMYVHARIETSLEILISDSVLDSLQLDDLQLDTFASVMFYTEMNKIYEPLKYSKKVNLALKRNKINETAKSLFYKVNDLRLYFSHPKDFEEKIDELKLDTKYKDALTTLLDALRELNRIFSDRNRTYGRKSVKRTIM